METNCRSDVGVSIGLIDSLIFISRVLSKRDLSDPLIKEALLDLQSDEDLKSLVTDGCVVV